jgi:hypothetical protein
MSIEEIVDLTIVVSTTTFTRPGFGTPLALVSKVPAGWGAAKVREFAKLSELTDLGFLTTDAGYKLASAITSQNPRPKRFKLAKRAAMPAQTITLECLTAVEGKVYALEVGLNGGALTSLTYTVPASATLNSVATAIAALISPLTGVAATSAAAVITVTPEVSGNLVNIKNWAQKGKQFFKLTDTTADPGIAAELDAAVEEDADFYGVLLDSNSEAEVKAAAAWAASNNRLHIAAVCDTDCKNPAITTDVGSDLKALSNKRSVTLFNENEFLSYAGAAWMARGFAFDPGKITWAFKDLVGVTPDKLTSGERTALKNKNINHYTTAGGTNITRWGQTSQGEYIDVTHGLDWLDAEMRLQVMAAIAGLPKLPYTKSGLAVIEGTIKGVLQAAVRQGILDAEGLFVTMPALEDIDATTRAQRLVPDIEFGGRLAGAIHSGKLLGTLTN